MHISADSNSLKATETIPSGCLCSRGVEREGEASRAEEGEQGAGEINTVITAWKCSVTVKVLLQHNTKYTYVWYLCEEAIVLGHWPRGIYL